MSRFEIRTCVVKYSIVIKKKKFSYEIIRAYKNNCLSGGWWYVKNTLFVVATSLSPCSGSNFRSVRPRREKMQGPRKTADNSADQFRESISNVDNIDNATSELDTSIDKARPLSYGKVNGREPARA